MRVIGLVLVLSACGLAESDVDRSLGEKAAAVNEHMHARFKATSAIATAIALSDLKRAHDEAKIVAALDEPDVLPQWQPYIAGIREAASRIVETDDTMAAARALADLGARCARCHQAAGAKLVFPKATAPRDVVKLPSQMASHQWAAARMWEGLIGANDSQWKTGANALATSRLAITAEAAEPGHDLGIADDAARVHLFAARAAKAGSIDDRAQLYGQMLATCAHCHATIRDR
jgi:hypothetical protein